MTSRGADGGEWIGARGGDSGPWAEDWDGDGRLDLLVGCGDGSVRLHRRLQAEGAPRLDAPVVLVPASRPVEAEGLGLLGRLFRKPDPAPRPGQRAKICTGDWNGDGLSDLFLGDFSSDQGPEPVLGDEQKAERDRLRKEQRELSGKLSAGYRRASKEARAKLGFDEGRKLSDEEQDRLQEEITEILGEDEEHGAVSERHREVYEKLRPLIPPTRFHGRVWIFLRKAPPPPRSA